MFTIYRFVVQQPSRLRLILSTHSDSAKLQLVSFPKHRIDTFSFANRLHTFHGSEVLHQRRVLRVLLLHRKPIRTTPAIEWQKICIHSRKRISHCMHALELFLDDGITPLNLSSALLTYLAVCSACKSPARKLNHS
jgi:hypothetical protein